MRTVYGLPVLAEFAGWVLTRGTQERALQAYPPLPLNAADFAIWWPS